MSRILALQAMALGSEASSAEAPDSDVSKQCSSESYMYCTAQG